MAIILHAGSFTLYGYKLMDPGTLTPSEAIGHGPGGFYITNMTTTPTQIPCNVGYSGPQFLDTTNDGKNWDAGAPPPGFEVKGKPSYPAGPNLDPYWPVLPLPNNAGTYDMGGKTGIDMTKPAVTQDDPLLDYNELLLPLSCHVTRLDGAPYEAFIWGRTGGSSAPALPGQPSPDGASIHGGYYILAFWWIIPDVTDCGDVNTQTPQDSSSHLTVSSGSPGPEWKRLDPNNPDAAPTPVITSLDPAHGFAGTDVTIWGSGFGDGATVHFDYVPATNVVVVSQYQITCTAPARPIGTVATVTVTNVDGVVSA